MQESKFIILMLLFMFVGLGSVSFLEPLPYIEPIELIRFEGLASTTPQL